MSEKAEKKKETKEEILKNDPDRLVDANDLVMGIKREGDHFAVFLNPNASKHEFFICIGELQHQLNGLLATRQLEAYKKMKQEKRIVGVRGGMNSIRNGLKNIKKH